MDVRGAPVIGRAALLALALAASPAPVSSPSPATAQSPASSPSPAATPSPAAAPSATSASATPAASPTPSNVFRSVALFFDGKRLIVAGGGVLRAAPQCSCATDVAGRAVVLTFGPDGTIVALRRALPADAGRPAKEIPKTAYVFVPHESDEDAQLVTVTIDVSVPNQTPPTDDVYLSSERSGWNPAEIRLNRVDALHFSAQLQLPAGVRFAYRITRGSFSTGERDAGFQLPPPHTLVPAPGAVQKIAVDNWADITN